MMKPAAQAVREVRHVLEAAIISQLVGGRQWHRRGHPPSSMHEGFSKELLEAIKCAPNGSPQESAILHCVLPEAVHLVKLKDRMHLGQAVGPAPGCTLTAGSSHLAGGRRDVCVSGCSMGLEYDLLLVIPCG